MISVIICHHKGDLIYKAIESLQQSSGVSFEIIVATSVAGLTFSDDVRTIYCDGGPALKRNVAAQFALGDYLAFYDDDVEVDNDSLSAQLKILLQNRRVGMTFGKLLNMEHHNRFDEAGSFLTPSGFLWARAESGCLDRGQYEKVEPVLAGKSAACMISKRVFLEVQGYDASYEILGEETDLAWRVWLAGYQVLYVPQSITYHAFNTKFKPRDFYIPRRVYFNGCRNYLSMLVTNLECKNLPMPCIMQTVIWVAASMGFAITGKFHASWNILLGLHWFFSHLPTILRKRKRVQESRRISDSQLFPYIMRHPGLGYYLHRFLRYIQVGLHG